jgi:DNA polymerase III subunit gamma/tau
LEEYRSLYRKYRPQAPDDVLGQEHVIRALAGAVREGRLGHAFLFSGPRGTGKTSTARILAKMVNCERGPTPDPCGECDQCLRIQAGSHLDVVEIDAASHGGVDDARELRERAPTAPVQGREKVYIIDEAQRLSREAFDALLKMFEEPPPGVRFVLATTEPHKMPATLASRCQRFEFRRIPSDTISAHLSRVAGEESIELAPEAAEAIARDAEGSVRDALSLLDQASVLGGGKVTGKEVGSLVGAPEMDVHFALADAVAVGDAREVFGIVHGLVQEGQDLRHFATQVTGHFRNLLLALASPEDPAIVDVPPELHPQLVAQAGKFSTVELDRILSLLLQSQTDMRWSTAPRLTIELALVRAAVPETDPQPAALLARLERLERLAGLPDSAPEGSATPPSGSRAVPSEGASSEPAKKAEGPAGDAGARSKGRGRAGSEATAPESADEGKAGGPAVGATVSPRQEQKPPAAGDEEAKTNREPEPSGRSEGSPRQAHAPKASAVDTEMLRHSWADVVEALKERRKMVLFANAQLATVGSYDGETMELVFPPGKEFAARNVEEKRAELVEVLEGLFGITPTLRCSVRAGMVPEPEPESDDPPSPEAAEALVREQFGAEVVEVEEE